VTATELRSEVAQWAERLSLRPTRVEVRPLRTKWASCSRQGRIILSRELLDAAPAVRAQVIVHELLHLRLRNHGRLFRRLLALYVPDAGGDSRAACSWRDERRGVGVR